MVRFGSVLCVFFESFWVDESGNCIVSVLVEGLGFFVSCFLGF